MTTIAELNRLPADALRQVLSGPPEAVARVMAAAAEGGSVEAQKRYGQILLDGLGAACDRAAALRWFGLAAEAGDREAMNMVGRCCEHGWGTRADPARAAQWYGAAADRGLDWGMYNLATLLALGRGVAEDRARALELFKRAAAFGHAKSMTMVGSFHEDGWAVTRDMAFAADCYRQGAEAGDFRGQFNHARMLIAAGRMSESANWVRCAWEGATPAFRAKLRAWLQSHDELAVRAFASTLVPTSHPCPVAIDYQYWQV